MKKFEKYNEILKKQVESFKFKLEKLQLVMKNREDNFTVIIKNLMDKGEKLKLSTKLMFKSTKSIYQNLALMIEDDFTDLKKVTKMSHKSNK